MLTKSDFVELLAESNEITKKAATEMYDSVFSMLAEVVSAGNDVAIPGLGRVKITERAARIANNPRTKEKVSVPAKKVPKFQFSKTVKEAVGLL